jgi:alkylation response protein AidB-like acyl-CoA dehydrogenase
MDYPKTARQAEFMALADRLAEQIAIRAPEHDRAGSFPHEAFRLLHESGYLALTVPEEYGGRGATPLETALAQSRLARGDGAVALGATMHLVLVGRLAETRPWPEALFARFCREVVECGALINSAASEPALGSPSRGGLPATTATRVDGGWRIDGRKSWTSLAPALRYAIVSTALHQDGTSSHHREQDGAEPRRANFLVPMAAEGVRIEETWDNLGMRASGSHDVVLDGVIVGDDALLPGDDAARGGDPRGWGAVVGSVYHGIGTAARDYAIRYARERKPTGLPGPIAELPTIQHRVAEIELLILQAGAVYFGTLEEWDAHPARRGEIAWRLAAGKYLTTNNAIKVTDLALRVTGSAGLLRAQPLERYFRDVRAGLGHPPADDIALTTIGKAALGL